SFFREAALFAALKQSVLPRILNERDRSDPVRIWSAGCSTGEEAYSLAICLREVRVDLGGDTPIQIFGTDVDEDAMETARRGIYPETIALDVSSERLRKFFVRNNGGFQGARSVRDKVVFA